MQISKNLSIFYGNVHKIGKIEEKNCINMFVFTERIICVTLLSKVTRPFSKVLFKNIPSTTLYCAACNAIRICTQ